MDAALGRFSRHFETAVTPGALTDEIMQGVAALRQARSGLLSPQLRDFLEAVAQTPRLQKALTGSGTPAEFVHQVLRLAGENGFSLRKGDVYALLQRYTAANDGELSDEALDGVAAGAGPTLPQFTSAGFPGDTNGSGLFSWSFGGKRPMP
jgi:hypothetical protein